MSADTSRFPYKTDGRNLSCNQPKMVIEGLTQKEIRNILMCRDNHIVSLVHLKRLGPVVQLVVKF
jgi:predicted DNA-binding helix-hairpin-helix protein